MNIRKRLIKVAGKILDEVVSDIQEKEMTSAINVGTEEGLKKYRSEEQLSAEMRRQLFSL